MRKHNGTHGWYVLSQPGVTYEIKLTCKGPPNAAAVAEVFVDGQTVFCPLRHTCLLRRQLWVYGFEKRRIVRPLDAHEISGIPRQTPPNKSTLPSEVHRIDAADRKDWADRRPRA